MSFADRTFSLDPEPLNFTLIFRVFYFLQMANSYTQIYIQAVFAVKFKQSLIQSSFESRLYSFICGILKNNGHSCLIINGMPDHIHLLFRLKPSQAISDLMRILKANSSKWINQEGFTKHPFSWQIGYGAFSYVQKDIESTVKYIKDQKNHHRNVSFREEYMKLLKEHGINPDEEYLFHWFDE